MFRFFRFSVVIALLAALGCLSALAQEQPKPAPPMSSTSRLTAAKTIFLKRGPGSEIPYNVVSGIMEGWGRFTEVNSPDKADLVIEVSAPDQRGGVSVSSTTRGADSTTYGSSSRQLSGTMVKMVVYDAKSKLPLWSASEQPKFAMKQKAREDSLVEAAEKLAAKFRGRVEPSLAK
jgi:hypothetical protein